MSSGPLWICGERDRRPQRAGGACGAEVEGRAVRGDPPGFPGGGAWVCALWRGSMRCTGGWCGRALVSAWPAGSSQIMLIWSAATRRSPRARYLCSRSRWRIREA
jgi:hypothetical protein